MNRNRNWVLRLPFKRVEFHISSLSSSYITYLSLFAFQRIPRYSNQLIRHLHREMAHKNISAKAENKKQPFTVFVEGNIGSGKTTFLKYFSNFDVCTLSEPVTQWRDVRGHNLLGLMYEDPLQWGFLFQSNVQRTMLENHVFRTDKPIKMMERSIYSARYCFVENLYREGAMSSPEFAVIDEWFNWLTANLNTSGNLIVYLRTDPVVVYNRMKARARPEETCVPLEYLNSLHQLHDDWLYNKTKYTCPAPVLVLDGNKDLIEMEEQYKKHEARILFSGATCPELQPEPRIPPLVV